MANLLRYISFNEGHIKTCLLEVMEIREILEHKVRVESNREKKHLVIDLEIMGVDF